MLCWHAWPNFPQVQRRDGSWVETHPPDGTVMVNVGDMMQRWTSDAFISTVIKSKICKFILDSERRFVKLWELCPTWVQVQTSLKIMAYWSVTLKLNMTVLQNHRLREPSEDHLKRKTRRSLVYFIGPDDDTSVSCLDGLNKYAPINSSEYLWQRANQHHLWLKEQK